MTNFAGLVKESSIAQQSPPQQFSTAKNNVGLTLNNIRVVTCLKVFTVSQVADRILM